MSELFSEFMREMNEFSTNGVVRELDHERVSALVEHFLDQCRGERDRNELEERIILLLFHKYQYSLTESQFRTSRRMEEQARSAIQRFYEKYFGEVGKYCGLAVNWVLTRPFKIIRSYVEPAVANTVLTYSVAVHTPHLDRVNFDEPLHVTGQQKVVVKEPDATGARSYEMLSSVQGYSSEHLAHLIETAGTQPEPRKAVEVVARPVRKSRQVASYDSLPSQSLRVDMAEVHAAEGRRAKSDTKLLEVLKIEKSLVSEIRPIGDIQTVIAQNELRIYNCYQLSKPKLANKNGRISVRFTISTLGNPKDIQVLHNSFNEELAKRIKYQIQYFKFAEVDARKGDQTIYHTFYF